MGDNNRDIRCEVKILRTSPRLRQVIKDGSPLYVIDLRSESLWQGRKLIQSKSKTKIMVKWSEVRDVLSSAKDYTLHSNLSQLAAEIQNDYGLNLRDVLLDFIKHKKSISFGELTKQYLQWLLPQRKVGTSQKGLPVEVKRCADYIPENTPIKSITQDMMEEVMDTVRGRYAASSCKNVLNRFRAIFNYAVKKGYLDVNPCSLVVVKVPRKDVETINLEQLIMLLRRPKKKQVLLFCVVKALLGLRTNEAIQLKADMFDFNNQSVTLPSHITKTGVTRVVSFKNTSLKQWIDYCGVDHLNFKPTLARYIFQYQSDLDLPKNCLRHTFITNSVLLGKTFEQVSVEVGNSPNVLRQHYLGVINMGDEDQIDVAFKYLNLMPRDVGLSEYLV